MFAKSGLGTGRTSTNSTPRGDRDRRRLAHDAEAARPRALLHHKVAVVGAEAVRLHLATSNVVVATRGFRTETARAGAEPRENVEPFGQVAFVELLRTVNDPV